MRTTTPLRALPCCETLAFAYGRLNRLLACAECHAWVKTFADRPGFLRYLAFCRAAHRPCRVGECDGLFVVTFFRHTAASPGGRVAKIAV